MALSRTLAGSPRIERVKLARICCNISESGFLDEIELDVTMPVTQSVSVLTVVWIVSPFSHLIAKSIPNDKFIGVNTRTQRLFFCPTREERFSSVNHKSLFLALC